MTDDEQARFQALSKVAVGALADDIVDGTAEELARCVRFVCADTRGLWHGRGRAKMCRRLKHREVTREQSRQLVTAISQRLLSGDFAEQFRDQLRLLHQLDHEAARTTALTAVRSDREHVRRLGHWLLALVERG